MTTKLNPCPFCKSDDLRSWVEYQYHYVVCAFCGAQDAYVDYTDEEHLTAEEAWNRRCK